MSRLIQAEEAAVEERVCMACHSRPVMACFLPYCEPCFSMHFPIPDFSGDADGARKQWTGANCSRRRKASLS